MTASAGSSSAPTSTERLHRLGRLGIAVRGTDRILPYLAAELEPLRSDDVPDARIAFDFGAVPRLEGAVLLSPLQVGADAYVARHGGLEYHVSGSVPSLHVRIRSLSGFGAERALPGSLLRAVDRNYLLPSEKVAKNFMYNVFDYLTQLANLAVGQSYLHASSFERDGAAVAMAAWGGVGKTTAMLKLVSEHGWRFLSDDLGLVDDGGTAWRTPKRMQVYAYNVQGQPRLYRTLMTRRSPMNRAAWHVRRAASGLDKVRRRVSAEELFGESGVSRSARLTHLFSMERADVPALRLEPITLDEVVRRSTATMMREVQPLADLISAMHSGGAHPVLPTHAEFLERTAEVLTRSLANARLSLIRVPLRTNPDELADFLVRTLDGAT
jgi:hypothetical protein